MTPAHPTHRAPTRTRRAAGLLATALLALTTAVVLTSTPSPVGAAPGSGTGVNGQSLTVSDVDLLDPNGTTVTVTGEGFDDAAGFPIATGGLYLSLCVDDGPSSPPSPCLGGVDQSGATASTRWVTNNPIGSAAAVPVAADGSFTTTLTIDPTDDVTDCLDLDEGEECKIVTRRDHRAGGDRTQDVKVPVTWAVGSRTATESFVTAALADFLGRPGTDQEVAAGVAAIDGGQTRAQFLRTLSTSDEWLESVVDQLYLDTLGREGDPVGTAFWVGELKSGRRSVAKVAAQLYASGEYFDGLGGGTVPTWIDDLYTKILGRSADSPGRAYWVAETQATGRGNVALGFYQSGESARTRVQGLYQSLLGRAGDQAGVDFWAPRVVTQGDLALAVFLAGSAEYADRALTRFP